MIAFARCFLPLLTGLMFSAGACAATPYLVDGDGDAVSDEIDDCPYTHPGVQVNAKGCPLRRDDGDLDAVVDDDDDCPYSAAGAVVDVRGCALDTDFDGVANGVDRCPRSALAQIVDLKGCAEGERTEMAKPATKTAAFTAPQAAVLPAPVQIIAAPVVPSPAPAPQMAPSLNEPRNESRAAVAESPEMVLRFGAGSARLSAADLAAIQAYAKVFARRLAASPGSQLRLRAYADAGETDVAGLVAARAAIVRVSLLQQGIAADRIKTDSGALRDGDAMNNRRVEARLDG